MVNAHILAVLAALGVVGDAPDQVRADAKFTATLSRQLESVKRTVYEIKYPDLIARQLVPVSHEADPAAETIVYREWDYTAMAQLVANYADDVPLVNASAEEILSKVHSLANAYQWTFMDLRRSAKTGNMLSERQAKAARLGIERKLDDLASNGDKQGALKGCLNHPNVTVLTAVDPGSGQKWATGTDRKTGDQILADMSDAVSGVITQSKGVWYPDTIALPVREYAAISLMKLESNPTVTVLKWFLANNPYIKNIVPWYKLDTSNAAGTGPRMWVYKRSEECFTFEIPQEFEQLPPQAVNMAYKMICHARCGGVIMYQPLSMTYMDGI